MEWIPITSRQNPLIKKVSGLKEKKNRTAENSFPVEGATILKEALQAGKVPEAVFVSAGSAEKLEPLLRACLPEGFSALYKTEDFVFEKITSEKGSEGILSVFSYSETDLPLPFDKGGFYLALENVQDPGNIGAVLRSAAAFGCGGVFLCGGADPYGPKAVRASMGAVFRMPVRFFETSTALLAFLKENGIFSVAATLSSQAVSIKEIQFPDPVCVWIGNEGQGLSESAVAGADSLCIIPIENMESLNAAAAAAIFLWELKKKTGERNG